MSTRRRIPAHERSSGNALQHISTCPTVLCVGTDEGEFSQPWQKRLAGRRKHRRCAFGQPQNFGSRQQSVLALQIMFVIDVLGPLESCRHPMVCSSAALCHSLPSNVASEGSSYPPSRAASIYIASCRLLVSFDHFPSLLEFLLSAVALVENGVSPK